MKIALYALGLGMTLALASGANAEDSSVEGVDMKAKVGTQVAIAADDATAVNANCAVTGYSKVRKINMTCEADNQIAGAAFGAYAGNFNGVVMKELPRAGK